MNIMNHLELFESVTLAAKPKIIKVSPKSDMAIIWFCHKFHSAISLSILQQFSQS